MSSCVPQTKGREEIKIPTTLSPSQRLPASYTVAFETQPTMELYLVLLFVAWASAEHSGAYSSPQYAKKMYPKAFDVNALPREKPPIPFKVSLDKFIVMVLIINNTT